MEIIRNDYKPIGRDFPLDKLGQGGKTAGDRLVQSHGFLPWSSFATAPTTVPTVLWLGWPKASVARKDPDHLRAHPLPMRISINPYPDGEPLLIGRIAAPRVPARQCLPKQVRPHPLRAGSVAAGARGRTNPVGVGGIERARRGSRVCTRTGDPRFVRCPEADPLQLDQNTEPGLPFAQAPRGGSRC